MTATLPTLHIIVPCFNEARTVAELLRRVTAVDFAAMGVRGRVIVVDDGSRDGSRAAIETFIAGGPAIPVELLAFPHNRGKGRAIREALERVADGLAVIQDADLEYSPEQYPRLVRPLLAGVVRVVYGSRWIGRDRLRMSGWLYALGGFLENQFLHLLYRCNISDIATCYKAFDAALLKSLPLQCERFEFCPEVTALLLNRGEPIMEAPIAYAPRKKGDGKKIRWPDFFVALRTLWRVRRLLPARPPRES
jgi:glycosyltransferase involved in cell wall biosynthesis